MEVTIFSLTFRVAAMSQCPSNYFLLFRDQVELADGDALVPVAHFSKEVRIILPGVK